MRVRFLLILYFGKVIDLGKYFYVILGLLFCGLNVLELRVKLRIEGISICIKKFNV